MLKPPYNSWMTDGWMDLKLKSNLIATTKKKTVKKSKTNKIKISPIKNSTKIPPTKTIIQPNLSTQKTKRTLTTVNKMNHSRKYSPRENSA